MWPRHIEVMLACWLAITPFVFADDAAGTRAAAWSAASAVTLFSLISYWPRVSRAYLLTALTGALLAGWAYATAGTPPDPVKLNFIVTGVLLVMFGIIPCYNNDPPRSWARYHSSQFPPT